MKGSGRDQSAAFQDITLKVSRCWSLNRLLGPVDIVIT
jgi:hypothetical protein